MRRTYVEIDKFVGLTFTKVVQGGFEGNDALLFIEKSGDTYIMYHDQECCESVTLEDICGDLSDLVDSPILTAYESTNDVDEKTLSEAEIEALPYHDEAMTWTFYNIATIKGSVTLRWFGGSNGYYSVGVDIIKR